MLDAIKKRRSCRNFFEEGVVENDLIEIIKAGEYAPSAMGNHAVEYLIITKSEIKKQIYDIVGQDFIRNAPVLIVPIVDTEKSPEQDKDIAVASENIMLQAQEMDYGTVWKNVSEEWEKRIIPIIRIPKNKHFINIIPIGKCKDNLLEHSGSDFQAEKIHWEKW